MIDVSETLSNKIDDALRPLGITRSFRSYRALRECIIRICEQEDRLEAVQKECYEPIAETQHCKWKAIQGVVCRAAKLAWEVNPDAVRVMAVYPLTGRPSAVQFLEMVYNAVVRGCLKRVAVAQKVAQIIY